MGDHGPTTGNGKVCYIEMPAADIKRSASFYQNVLAGTFERVATDRWLLMTASARSAAHGCGAGHR